MIIRAPYPDISVAAQREFTPADLPADFKLFEWDFARNDRISLDGSSKIASISDNWQGRAAGTANATNRRSLSVFNGVQCAYRPGSGADTDASGITLSDLSGLPLANQDRFLGFCVVPMDGIIGGYRGDTSKIYCLDSPSDPGVRFYYDDQRVTAQTATDRTSMHWITIQHEGGNSTTAGTSTLRVDGVTVGTYSALLGTVLDQFGIVGAESSFYPMVGYTAYAMVGKRAPTQDERWRIDWWVARNKSKRTIPNDSPYANTPPMVNT